MQLYNLKDAKLYLVLIHFHSDVFSWPSFHEMISRYCSRFNRSAHW